MSDKAKKNLLYILSLFLSLAVTLIGTKYGVHLGIKANNENIEVQEKQLTINDLKSASKETKYQLKLLDNITGNLEELNYEDPIDLVKLERALYYFHSSNMVLPYPKVAEDILGSPRVRRYLSPTGINTIYMFQEQLGKERRYILGEENSQQEYMLATGMHPLHEDPKLVGLAVDVFVRKEALSGYKSDLSSLAKLLDREVEYVNGKYSDDEMRVLNTEENIRQIERIKEKQTRLIQSLESQRLKEKYERP